MDHPSLSSEDGQRQPSPPDSGSPTLAYAGPSLSLQTASEVQTICPLVTVQPEGMFYAELLIRGEQGTEHISAVGPFSDLQSATDCALRFAFDWQVPQYDNLPELRDLLMRQLAAIHVAEVCRQASRREGLSPCMAEDCLRGVADINRAVIQDRGVEVILGRIEVSTRKRLIATSVRAKQIAAWLRDKELSMQVTEPSSFQSLGAYLISRWRRAT